MPESITIKCPQCSAKLRLSDPARLGKKLKCPKCKNVFVAESSQLKKEIPLPKKEIPLPEESNDPVTLSDLQRAVPETDFPNPSTNIEVASGSVLERVNKRKSKKKSSGAIGKGIILLGAIGVAVGGYFLFSGKAPTGNSAAITKNNATKNVSTPVKQRTIDINTFQPTSGGKISLKMLPAGVTIFVHLHPQLMYQDSEQMKTFRESLGPILPWLESKTKSLCQFDIQDIESVTYGIIPGPEGIVPDFAAVVHLKNEVSRVDIIKRMGGEPQSGTQGEVYVNEKFAWMLPDTKTFAICPKKYAEDLWLFRSKPAFMLDDIQKLLFYSDSDRFATFFFHREDLKRHIQTLFPVAIQPAAEVVVNWFNDEIVTVLWSVHLDEVLFSEIKLKTGNTVLGSNYEKELNAQIDSLPHELMSAVRKMQPALQGPARLIGRFPAMMDSVNRSTVTKNDRKIVTIKTLLPKVAAPNLALAGRFTSLEVGKPVQLMAQAPTQPKPKTIALPNTLLERLDVKIDVEFNRTPLEDALKTITDEIQVTLDINGKALKLEAYTKNMPQTFAQNQITVRDALHTILSKYEKMIVFIDEKTKTINITTKVFAAENKIEPYILKP